MVAHPNQTVFREIDVNNCIDYLSGRSYNHNLVKPWYNLCRVQREKIYMRYMDKWYHIIPFEKYRDMLLRIINDPARASFSRDGLYNKVKERYFGISKRMVESFLENLEAHQLRKRYIRPRIVAPINSTNTANSHWSIDLVDMQQYKGENFGYAWIFSMIDVFSKKLYSFPLKTKSAEDILTTLRSFFATNPRPKVFQSDNDPSFHSKQFKAVMKAMGIKHVFSKTYSPTSNSIIERVQGTIKNAIYHHFNLQNNHKWISILQPIVRNYNNTIHSKTGSSPNALNVANSNDDIFRDAQRRIQKHASQIRKAPVFFKGEKVRIASKSMDLYRKNPLKKVVDMVPRNILH